MLNTNEKLALSQLFAFYNIAYYVLLLLIIGPI